MRFLLALGIVLGFVRNAPQAGSSVGWGGRELAEATEAALRKFEMDYGVEASRNVLNFSVRYSASGAEGKVVLSFLEETKEKSVEYFCHFHDSKRIDCH